MSKYVKPFSDTFVRYLLGDEKNTDILKSFINAVNIDSGFLPVVEVSIQNPYNLKDYASLKESILDVKATDETGKMYDIEVQVLGDEIYAGRAIYNLAKLYTSQMNSGDEYHKLKPAISINLLLFNLFKERDDYHSCFQLREENNKDLILSDHFKFHFLELKKFRKNVNFKEKLDDWLAFFKYEGKQESIMSKLSKKDKDIKKAHMLYEKFTSDEQLMEVYENREKYKRDEATNLRSARERGFSIGVEQGLEKGIEQGIEQGVEQVAQKMIKHGMPYEEISKITGLSLKDLKKIDI